MKKLFTYALIFGAGIAVTALYFQHVAGNHHFAEMHQPQHTENAAHQQQGGHAHTHDEVNMPGLQGKDTTEQEVNDLKTIFRAHKGIGRVVSNIPNGIITTTEATDIKLREAIISHVSMMVTRLQEGKNPEVIIQSPTLDALFEVYEEIDTEIELTDTGVKVTQTSENPDVIKLLQTHAAEVSDMSKRGMQAVHERMAGSSH